MNIETRTEYRSLNDSLEAGELIAEATFDAMVVFAKEKKMKRPARPEAFFVEAKPTAKPKTDRPMSRKECVARLAELGFNGPTSYLMPVLRNIVTWAEAGFPVEHTQPDAVQAASPKLAEA